MTDFALGQSSTAEIAARLAAERDGGSPCRPARRERRPAHRRARRRRAPADDRPRRGRRTSSSTGIATSPARTPSSSASAASGRSPTTGSRATARSSTASGWEPAAPARRRRPARRRHLDPVPRPDERGRQRDPHGRPGPRAADVSEAQRKVLLALCRPYKAPGPFTTPATNQDIAGELFLSVEAVKTHLRALFAKFGVEDLPQNQKRAKLIERAFQTGLVSERDL